MSNPHTVGVGQVCFVFGSNLAGRHGAGAARTAYEDYGAVMGVGVGLRGNSYAIPTKDASLNTLPLAVIAQHVATFLEFARSYPHTPYLVTAVGCGLAGYSPRDIAPLFRGAPPNVTLPNRFRNILMEDLYR